MSWAMVGAAAVSAGAGIYGSQKAANAQGDSAKKNAQLQQQNLLMQLGLTEPQRALGYGAMSDLASLYGYSLPAYRTGSQLMSANNGATINVKGQNTGGNSLLAPLGKGTFDPLGLGADKKKFGGTIDPVSGTVNITNGGKKASQKEAMLQAYLRTGQGAPSGGKMGKFVKQIDKLYGAGYKYDPAAAEAAANYSPVAESSGATGSAGNMDRFFTSPDYQFRLNEGQRNLGNSFAARGGATGGNALRALSEYNQGMASSEYGNYVNRLLSMSGMGQAANAQTANAANNYTIGTGNANTQAGDARASGVLGSAGSVIGALQGLGNYAGMYYGGMYNGSRQQTPPNTLSQYGPYAGGYRLPNNSPSNMQVGGFIDQFLRY